MCGIAGIAGTTSRFEPNTLIRMRDALFHRGPDAAGWMAWDGATRHQEEGRRFSVGLGHRRLSIIDLSPLGNQPMSNEDGSVWITFNGEYYNHADIHSELESKGHVFRSRCDTEAILHAYEEYGMDGVLQGMNGMFAFAIWDEKERRLFLARDRIGKKPLYYALLPDCSILFASEIKSLLASGLVDDQRLDLEALDQIWTFGYPMDGRTAYEQIRQVRPGHLAVWKSGIFTERKYWDCPFGVDVRADVTLDSLADELESILGDAVKIRLSSDVPLGLFLSGGIDSSLMAAITSKIVGSAIQTFTIAFADQGFDESLHAGAVAKHLGIENDVLLVDGDMMNVTGGISAHFDEPFGDSSAVPTYLVAKLAREKVTVALTGDGGDEMFAGYPWHFEGVRLWGHTGGRGSFQKSGSMLIRLRDAKLRIQGVRRGSSHVAKLLANRDRPRLFAPQFLRKVRPFSSWHEREKWFDQVKGADVLSKLQYVDIKTYLANDILVKVDRMSMARGLETRCPLLDYRVAEFAARLPCFAKFDNYGRGKHLLRHLLSRYIPKELFERPKQGFSVPWHDWCRGRVASELRQIWHSEASPHYRPDAADWLLPDDGSGPTHLKWTAFSVIHTCMHNLI